MNNFQRMTNPFIAFLMFGAVLVLMSISEIYGRASIEIDGVVINQEVVCQQPSNNRCVTNYLIKKNSVESQIIYSAGPTDQSLPRNLPVGAELKKEKWKLKFELNGKIINDFPIDFYIGLFVIGMSGIVTWFVKTNNDNKKI
ncbi:hypothetical protein [Undibacterium griseum]|uniref:DUF3592 domain-containing protein n=1 Tax=Undibacterium griseum TaxID=2762295 RepID=A0ABR6YIS5_9BURK|nr:hypothetical protein [Undibacterium griseum]MBC3883806.1 hypothetical protein [Undibacterium griseum]